jgi:hypothetical protein
MGLIEEPLKLPSREDDNLFGANELDEEVGSLKLDKLLTQKPLSWKVLAKTTKKYVPQITYLDDSEQKSKGQSTPFLNRGSLRHEKVLR